MSVSDVEGLLSVAPDDWTSNGVGEGEGGRLKLTLGVVVPGVTETVWVTEVKPGAEAVRVWLPGARLFSV